ncbi:MAG: protein translocase subunit SecD [Parvularculaceae bacterium]
MVAASVLLAAIFASPNFFSKDETANWPVKSRISLGLDLRGGSYLLLGVDTKKVIETRLTNLRQEIQRSMRPSGDKPRISLQSLPKLDAATDTISLRVKTESEVEDAAKRIRDLTRGSAVAGVGAGIRPYDVTVTGPRIDVVLSPDAKRYYARDALQQSIVVVRRRIDPAGNKEVQIQPQGDDRIVVQAPGDNDPEALKAIINRTGQLSFHRVDSGVSQADAQAGTLPPGRILVPMSASEGPGALVLYEEPEVTGDMVDDASAGLNSDGGGFQINFSFDNRGARRFGDYTREHVGELFAIVLDNEIISAPRIQSPITGGSGRITGSFSPEEAQRIATLIKSGALPAPLTTLEQRSIGPDLGRDSIRKGTISLAIGFIAVAAFMLFVYGRFGVYANIALIANIVLLAGALSLMGSTLTLPGIAGIVLTLGMAVDANVLIFERIREEARLGKSAVNAVELGFSRAWSAILDGNLTTLAAALIMFVLGAGPVRGFAVTLAVGIFTSVYSAIVITKILAGRYVLAKRPKQLVL